jgi:hypothetical protein
VHILTKPAYGVANALWCSRPLLTTTYPWAVVAGIGSPQGYSVSHNFFVITEGGASKRALWIDSLAVIKGLDRIQSTRSEFVIVLKDGSELSAMFVGDTPTTVIATEK